MRIQSSTVILCLASVSLAATQIACPRSASTPAIDLDVDRIVRVVFVDRVSCADGEALQAPIATLEAPTSEFQALLKSASFVPEFGLIRKMGPNLFACCTMEDGTQFRFEFTTELQIAEVQGRSGYFRFAEDSQEPWNHLIERQVLDGFFRPLWREQQTQRRLEALPRHLENIRNRLDLISATDAIAGLGPLGAEAVPDLVGLLSESDRSVVQNTIWALGRIGPAAQPAVDHLEPFLEHPNCGIRKETANAIQRICAANR